MQLELVFRNLIENAIRYADERVRLASKLNVGSTFTVFLPLNEYEPKERENQRTLQLSFKPN